MSHAIFLKNEKTTKWAFFGIKNVKNGKIHFLFNPRRNTILFDMSHALFSKNEKTTKWAFFRIKNVKNGKNHFLFNSQENNLSFDMSHAIFLKNEKTTKLAFFCIKKIKNDKNHFFEKNAKKIFSPVMRRFQNAKDIQNPLKTSLFTKENPPFWTPQK